MSAAAAARRRRQKADPVHNQKLGTLHQPAPVVCAWCLHARLLHDDGRCHGKPACGCSEYVEIDERK